MQPRTLHQATAFACPASHLLRHNCLHYTTACQPMFVLCIRLLHTRCFASACITPTVTHLLLVFTSVASFVSAAVAAVARAAANWLHAAFKAPHPKHGLIPTDSSRPRLTGVCFDLNTKALFATTSTYWHLFTKDHQTKTSLTGQLHLQKGCEKAYIPLMKLLSALPILSTVQRPTYGTS